MRSCISPIHSWILKFNFWFRFPLDFGFIGRNVNKVEGVFKIRYGFEYKEFSFTYNSFIFVKSFALFTSARLKFEAIDWFNEFFSTKVFLKYK